MPWRGASPAVGAPCADRLTVPAAPRGAPVLAAQTRPQKIQAVELKGAAALESEHGAAPSTAKAVLPRRRRIGLNRCTKMRARIRAAALIACGCFCAPARGHNLPALSSTQRRLQSACTDVTCEPSQVPIGNASSAVGDATTCCTCPTGTVTNYDDEALAFRFSADGITQDANGSLGARARTWCNPVIIN